jgi:hypothetical protein
MDKIQNTVGNFNQKANEVISGLPMPLLISLSVIIVAVVTYFIRAYFKLTVEWKRYVTCGRCYTRFKNKSSNIVGMRPISSHLIPNPNSGNDCTYSMWLYIADWNTNYGKWKAVFSKSPTFPTCSSSVKWDMVPNQCPGVWLGDTLNNLRVVVQTTVAVPKRCMHLAEDLGADESSTAPATASSLSIADCMKVPQANTMDVPILEFSEMENVPIGKWFQFTFILRDNFVELYKNGDLFSTTPLKGKPRQNVLPGRFSPVNPFGGRMCNFRYMPHALLVPMIRRLYVYEASMSFLDIADPMEDDK